MRTITTIGSQSVSDEELGPQIDWERLRRRLKERRIKQQDFCDDVHIWLYDFGRYLRGSGVPASARTRLRVAYHVAILGLDDDGTIVREGKQPTNQSKVG